MVVGSISLFTINFKSRTSLVTSSWSTDISFRFVMKLGTINFWLNFIVISPFLVISGGKSSTGNLNFSTFCISLTDYDFYLSSQILIALSISFFWTLETFHTGFYSLIKTLVYWLSFSSSMYYLLSSSISLINSSWALSASSKLLGS